MYTSGGFKRRYWRLRSDLQDFDFRGMIALGRGLREFFGRRVTLPEAEEEIKRGLDRRGDNFLELARLQIYARPASPYLKLLQIAGCDFSDMERAVRQHGLEATLEKLAAEGVCLTSAEFKGKEEVKRGGRSFRVKPQDFARLGGGPALTTQSSGTTNQAIRHLTPLDWLALRTFSTGVFLAAHDLFPCSHAMYDAILPGGGGVNNLLIYAKLGIRTERWFARAIPSHSWITGRYHYLMTYLVVMAGKRIGPGFPRPEFLDVQDTGRIVRWLSEKKRTGKSCCVTTAASNAARIARVALEMGLSLEGTKFIVSGEPFTEAKCDLVSRAGASATPRYAFGGGLNIGHGCANPFQTDEIHINQHLLALIPRPEPLESNGRPQIRPLLVTNLSPLAPYLMLNIENGDYATFERRDCGCALERAGLTLHLHHIRSHEKFTSEGMNYFYGDLFELLEKKLPDEFGGGPGDYQLAEEEDGNGQTRLTLRVHPRIGDLDEEMLLLRLREGLGTGSWGNQLQSKIWQAAGTLRVRREIPHASPRGKILPLHLPH